VVELQFPTMQRAQHRWRMHFRHRPGCRFIRGGFGHDTHALPTIVVPDHLGDAWAAARREFRARVARGDMSDRDMDAYHDLIHTYLDRAEAEHGTARK